MHARSLLLCAALVACSAPLVTPGHDETSPRRGPYAYDLVDEAGHVLPTFWHQGRTYVLGATGRRYLIRVRNDTGRRAEVVVSVDGRDVIDGQPASWGKRGYLVEPYGRVEIDGYRLSQGSVAAFRFSSVPRSYAALEGDARDVGVIGVAVFPERPPVRMRAPSSVPSDDGPGAGSRSTPRGKAEARESPQRAPSPGGVQADRRPGLGTEFGEEHDSRVRLVPFERANTRPEIVMTLRYDDRPGLIALGIDVDHSRRSSDDAALRRSAAPFRLDAGFAAPPPGWTPGRPSSRGS
jgi:hypothetical protein